MGLTTKLVQFCMIGGYPHFRKPPYVHLHGLFYCLPFDGTFDISAENQLFSKVPNKCHVGGSTVIIQS
jgi:hypothetical protein